MEMPRSRLARFRAGFLLLFSLGIAGAFTLTAAHGTTRDIDVVFFPTPQAAVDKMLDMAAIKPGDMLIDLGSGDGRIPITAAKIYGARALGVDLDAKLVADSQAAAARENVADKVSFRVQDLFETDLSGASVVSLFLSHSINMKLMPRLKALKPGTRIVSYGFAMGDWEPDRTERVNGRNVYLWVVRESAADAKR